MLLSARVGVYFIIAGIMLTGIFSVVSLIALLNFNKIFQTQSYVDAIVISPSSFVDYNFTSITYIWCISSVIGLIIIGYLNKNKGIILCLISGIILIFGIFIPISISDIIVSYDGGKILTIHNGIVFTLTPSNSWYGGILIVIGGLIILHDKNSWSLTSFKVNIPIDLVVERAVLWLRRQQLEVESVHVLGDNVTKLINFSGPIGFLGTIIKRGMIISLDSEKVKVYFKQLRLFGSLSHSSAKKAIMGAF